MLWTSADLAHLTDPELADYVSTLEVERARLTRRARSLEMRRVEVEEALQAATSEWQTRMESDIPGSAIGRRRLCLDDLASEDFARASVPEACLRILKRAGQPLTVHELLDVLERSGRSGGGTNRHRVVYAALRRRPSVFMRAAPGRFGLTVWSELDDGEHAPSGHQGSRPA